jgi:hypothetical protein
LSKDGLQRLTLDAEKLVQHGEYVAKLGADILVALKAIGRPRA